MFQQISLSGQRPGRGTMRMLFGSLLVAAAAVAVQPSFAAGGDHHRGGSGHGEMSSGGSRHMGKMLDKVDATEAQRAQIKQIHEAAKVDMKPLREAGRSLRERSSQLLNSPNAVDRGAAESLRLEMMALHDQVSKRRLDAMLAVADVLTPEQRAKIGEMRAKRGDHMRKRMERHHGEAAPKS